MNELLTYTVFHTETDKVVASGLGELDTIELIHKMIREELVKGIELSYYLLSSGSIDVLNLLVDIRKQGIFDFEYTWHVG